MKKGISQQAASKREKNANRKKSSAKARVEQHFAFMENSINEMFLH
jgi:hypothetical protein